ncbi:DUF1800 domain-containing protein [Spirosoma luteolum]
MPVWNTDTARHLLTRTLFGYTRSDLARALTYPSAADFVSRELLADRPQPAPPADWVAETPVAGQNATDQTRYRDLTSWWLDRMLTEGTSMREKMVLFWHNHFTSARDKVTFPQHMYQQQTLFRQYAFGDFRQLTKAVTIDPAMLIYLDGRQSTKNAPNENYGRELLELFTLGIGNYTETDIKQAALALTGWRVDGLKAVFTKANWADTPKTFLGQTGNFTYADIVDVILTRPAAAAFICRKLYTEFVYYKPNEAFISDMATVFRQANYQLKPVLQFMLTAEEFYRPDYRGGRIKSPTDIVVGTVKQLGLTSIDRTFLADTAAVLQQRLFFPPNVAGWPGQRNWISSNTYPARAGFTDALVTGRRSTGQVVTGALNALDFARSFTTSEDAPALVRDMTSLLLQFPLNATRQQQLLDTMLDGTIVSNWSTNTPMADLRVQKLLKALFRQPEYQLN